VALGFAATENTLYLFGTFTESGWGGFFVLFFLRVIIGAWAHPLYTAWFGIGLATARMNRNVVVKILAPLGGLALGMFLHGLDNGILTVGQGFLALGAVTIIEWVGWLFIIGVMIFALISEGKAAKQYLYEEINLSGISQEQYLTACSFFKRIGSWWKGLFGGQFRATNRFYQVCGELVHKKKQYERLGDESGNAAIILKLRQELNQLAPSALY
jgi:protease PrsW